MPVDLDLAAVAAHRAGQGAHQGGLARAVLADHADDLAGVQVELGQVQHAHRAVGLVHAPQPRGDRAAGAPDVCSRFTIMSADSELLSSVV